MTPPAYLPSFGGEIALGEESLPPDALVLIDRELRYDASALGLVAGTALVVVADGRPDQCFVKDAVASADEAGVIGIAAVGCGALLDAAKLVALRLEKRRGRPVRLTFVPCGAEPYRAVARFAVVDDGDERPTVVDDRFRQARIVLAPRLLAGQDQRAVAVHALDTAVHCVESLLSARAHPYARLLAAASLRTVVEELSRPGSELGVTCTRLFAAAAAAVEAFATTRLGLAHAIASPLGTRLAVTHDSLNGILGESVIAFWGEDVPGFADVAAALDVAESAAAVAGALATLRRRAGLPGSLAELGVPWESVEAILPQAARSSGMPALPAPVGAAGLASFAARAWAGDRQEEVTQSGVA